MGELEKTVEELRFLQAKSEQARGQINTVVSDISQIELTVRTLNELKTIKKEKDGFIPIGSDIFIKTEFVGPEKVLVNLGASAVSEKTVPEAIEFLNDKKNKLELIRNSMVRDLKDISERAEFLNVKARKIYEQQGDLDI